MNLLQETLEVLQNHNKTPQDISWIGNKNLYMSWQEFASAADVEYDAGYGAPEVAQDLVIVGADWWMTREEYDGSEWWSFKTKPQKPPNAAPPNIKLIITSDQVGWEDLSSINGLSTA